MLFIFLAALAIVVGLNTFLNPGTVYPSFPIDPRWAALWTVAFAGLALLAAIRRGEGLLLLGGAGGLVVLLALLFFSPSARPLLVSLWLALDAFLLGDLFLALTDLGRGLPKLDRAALALATGYAGLMILSTLMGFAHLVYPLAAWIVLAAPLVFLLPSKVVGLWRLRQWDWRAWLRRPADLRFTAWGLAALVVCGLGALLWALAPAVRWDALSYHIPVPLLTIQNHAFVEMPESIQSYWAHYAETLYTLGMLIDPSAALPGLIHFQMGALTALLTFCLGRKLGGRVVGLLAAVLFWSLPIIQVEAGSAYIDMFTAVFTAAMVYCLWIWQERRSAPLPTFEGEASSPLHPRGEKKEPGDGGLLLLAGVMAGMAVGIKLTAVFFAGLAGAWLILWIVRARLKLRPGLWVVASFVLPALLVAAPWFVRDWAWTGNPIFPNYNQVFQSPKAPDSGGYFEFTPSGRGLAQLLTLPQDLLFNSVDFYHEMPGFALGGLSLFALPWLYPWVSRRERRRVLAALGGFALLSIALTLQVSSNFRYLIPIFPILAILAAENLGLLWECMQTSPHRRWLLLAALILGSAYLVSTQLAVVVKHVEIAERYPYRYVLGRESADAFLTRAVSNYAAYRFLEEKTAPPRKILSLGNELRLYTSAQIFGPLFSPEADRLLHGALSSEELYRALKAHAYTHLILYQPEIAYRPQVYTAPALTGEFLGRYTRPLYAQNQFEMFTLLDEPVSDRTSPNLLANPGFETLTPQGLPAAWEFSGSPLVSSEAERSHSGQVAVRIAGPSVSAASQTVPVEAGRVYALGYWANPEGSGQTLQLFVQWLRPDGSSLPQAAQWKALADGWHSYQALVTAPPDAAYARFVVSTAAPGLTWFDDLCLTTAGACW